ncbi:hypothetical protein ACHQM5_030148 [Ranunculus cassubicifolius]
MVASSGIASLLLTGGRTAHSTFKLPLEIMDNSVCGFVKNSDRAIFLKKADLIIWDEVPMQHRHCVEAVNRTLQDIRNDEAPFGGITVVLGGDFRQTLPIITKGVREDFVGASLRRSPLWQHVNVLNLIQNMRLDARDQDNMEFAEYLMKVGSIPTDTVELPNGIRRCKEIEDLITTVYPGIENANRYPTSYLTERTILSARNDDVSKINDATLSKFPPRDATEYLSADKVVEDDIEYEDHGYHYTTDFLNSLDPSCLPPFKLKLKIGCPIMLLRNIAPRDGLCNGTRLMVLQCRPRVIEAMILTGNKAGDKVFIPRITLTPSTSQLPFKMSRRQFPVRLAFAMTINKSQGQSVKYVGIDLRTPVFSHGQLYVALSRCTSSKRISVVLPPEDQITSTNVVYPEVLL